VGGGGGRREVLALVLTELKNHGVQEILIVGIDGLKGFREAIESVYPQTQIQLCIVHMVGGSLKFVAWKERKAVARDLRTMYQAPTLEAAEEALEALSNRWDGRRYLDLTLLENTEVQQAA